MFELSRLQPHRIFLRRTALAAGYDDKDLISALRAGEIVRVRHGAYTPAEVWAAADLYARHRLRCHAVLATHGDEVVLSHTSAVVMHGLDVWGCDLSQAHLTRLDRRASRVTHDIRYHRGELPPAHVEPMSAGGAVTTAARACVDHASINSVQSGLVTVDSYLRRNGQEGVEDLHPVYAAQNGWPGTRRLQITLRLARCGSGSVGESRLRFLCWEHALPEPELQVRIFDNHGALVATTDFGWRSRSLLGEFDGKVKYERYLRPGETPSDAVFREKRREDQIREGSGCSMIRFTWPDLHTRERTAQRLRHALGIR